MTDRRPRLNPYRTAHFIPLVILSIGGWAAIIWAVVYALL